MGYPGQDNSYGMFTDATSTKVEKYLRIKLGVETELARQHDECVILKTFNADMQNDLANC